MKQDFITVKFDMENYQYGWGVIEMPEKDKRKKEDYGELSDATEKRINQLPEHAQHIFKKAHSSALKQYENPEKRRGGTKEDVEEVAHKVDLGCREERIQEKR